MTIPHPNPSTTCSEKSFQDTQSEICDKLFSWLSVLAIPTLAASLYRTIDIGWKPVMAIQILLAVAIWSVYFLRDRIPYRIRAGCVVSVFSLHGLAGIWTFGLAAFSASGLVIAPILGMFFFPLRSGFIILGCITLMTTIIGAMTVLGHRPPPLDFEIYLASAAGWVSAGAYWVFTGASVGGAVGVLKKQFVESSETSQRHLDALVTRENDYLSILDNMVDTFYRADNDGRLVMITPSVLELFGYSPEELIGRRLTDFYADKVKRVDFLERLYTDGGRIRDFQTEVYRRDGTLACVSTSARFWRDVYGNVMGVEGVIRDITAYKESQKALQRSQKIAAIGQLSGGIAHDYNNMLQVIIGNVRNVQRAAKLDDRSQQRLDKACFAATRNVELTKKLLGFTSMEASGTEPTVVNDIIFKLKDVIASSLTPSIRVRFNLSDDLWMVNLDPAEFEDMILNLALNAHDAMPYGGFLEFRTGNKALDHNDVPHDVDVRAGDYIVVTVSDTGVGMSADVREQIFDPFFSTKEVGEGAGLGLSMVYAFVQRSGGFIKVISEQGKGAVFKIYLPRVKRKAVPVKEPELGDEIDAPRGTETVLIVDDENMVIEVAVACLEDLGYKTLTAFNGSGALDVLKTNPSIDLLFSDVIMTGPVDGYDLAVAALTENPSLKVLLASGYAKDSEQRTAEKNEIVTELAARLLPKPYDYLELAVAVRATLDSDGLRAGAEQARLSEIDGDLRTDSVASCPRVSQ